MKKLSFINKILFLINNVFAILLILSLALPYIPPTVFPTVSVLSLTVPILIFVNLAFVIYWLLGLKKQLFLSLICLFIGFNFFNSLYKFKGQTIVSSNKLKVMSYNVRMFNIYKWIDNPNLIDEMTDFIKVENPDILCLQEYHDSKKINFNYPYKYIKITQQKQGFGQAIFSKYPIVKSGSLNFKKTINNAIFIDIVKNEDTLRVYNVHLESLKLKPSDERFNKKSSEKLLKRIGSTFANQQNQIDLLKKSINACTYKKIICGDLNNTAFSWAYHQLSNELNDSFKLVGNGFGTTYKLFKIPLRIDFIFTDKSISVDGFKNYLEKYSDHYPIMATIEF